MWNEIANDKDLADFMDSIYFFHDSCIKELRYISGAYVGEKLSMYPINDRRVLSVIIQRQSEENTMIEMEFEKIKFLKLFPTDEKYTCEILGATMILKNDCIYWCDCGGLSESDLDHYDGTVICAAKLRWRPIDNCIGQKDFYIPTL